MCPEVDITGVRIETQRLILRPWREDDLEDFYEYARVKGVGEMAGWQPHENIEKSRQILTNFIEGKKTFALELKENGKVIGSLGLESGHGHPEFYESELVCREIGYVLSKDYWGRGLMPEAVEAVIRYCFETLRYDFVTCGHFVSNDQSRRVIEKCGFSFVKEFDYTTRMGTVERTRLYVRYNPTLER